MGSLMVLYISGNQYLFDAQGITPEQEEQMQALADARFGGISFQEEPACKEICEQFQRAVREGLGITLHPVEVTVIIRIN